MHATAGTPRSEDTSKIAWSDAILVSINKAAHFYSADKQLTYILLPGRQCDYHCLIMPCV
jgi:hypothetical protein